MDFFLSTPDEICKELGNRVKKRRQALQLQQNEVAQKSGLSRRTIITLENTGKCALDCFIRVLYALNMESELESFLKPKISSLDELEDSAPPSRIRKKKASV